MITKVASMETGAWCRKAAVCFSALIAGVAMAGCSGDTSDSKPLPDASAAKTASGSESKNAEALTAYRAMWRDLTEAARTSDAASPQLDDHASGAALDMLKQGLQRGKREKLVVKGSPRLHPVVDRVGPAHKVELRDCVDSTGWLQYRLNGELKNNVPGGHGKAEATVERDGHKWKVTVLSMYPSGTC